MKTPAIDTSNHAERPRTLSWIVAAIALAVGACSPPASQQSAGSLSQEQTASPGQSAASVPQERTGEPPASQLTQAPPPSEIPAPVSAPVPDVNPVPAPAPAPVTPKVARLNAGQVLTIRTTRLLSTKTMKTGDAFSAIVEEPIAVEGWVVVPAGARVDGRIAEADDGGRLKGKAKLSIELTSLTTGDGQKVDIVTTPVGAEAAANRGQDAKRVGVGAGAGAGVGAIAGGGKGAAVGALIGAGAGAAMRGDAADIPAESVLAFELRSPITIQQREDTR